MLFSLKKAKKQNNVLDKKQKKLEKKNKKKMKIKEQYPNRSDYRLLLSIKPIQILHDLCRGVVKLLNYADKAGSLFQFIMNKRREKND